MIRFEQILDKVESYKPDFDEELLQRAYVFSAREHRGQKRSSGEPYLVHPLNVAYILSEMRLDETSIAVGLLHDVLEDTLTTKETLQNVFGEDVAELVDGVTKISQVQLRFARKSSRLRPSARCCWRWSPTSASCSSSWPTASTTCGRCSTCRKSGGCRWPRRRWRSTRPSPTVSAWGCSSTSSKTSRSAISIRGSTRELNKAVSEKLAVSGDVVERIKATLTRETARERDRGRGLRPCEVDALDLVEARPAGDRHRPALRLSRLPHHHSQREGLLRVLSASSTRCGARSPDGSRTTSPCRSRISINRSTPPWSQRRGSRSRCRSGPGRWT